MAVSSKHWCFGRAHATGRMRITILSFWRKNDPSSYEEHETQIIQSIDGQVKSTFVPFHCVDVIELNTKPSSTLVVGSEGDVAIIKNGKLKRDFLDNSDDGPSGRGNIRSLSQVSGQIYAVGMQRQVYLLNQHFDNVRGDNCIHYEKGLSWSPIEMSGFNALDGFSSDELYAAGWRGELQICEQGRWRLIEMPTNLKLERLIAAPDKNVYIAGLKGILLFGRGDSFKIIEHDITEDSFWGICWAFDCLWLASADKVFRLKDGNFEEVNLKLGQDMTCRCLTAAEGRLWSIGTNHVIFTDDGQTWQQVFFDAK